MSSLTSSIDGKQTQNITNKVSSSTYVTSSHFVYSGTDGPSVTSRVVDDVMVTTGNNTTEQDSISDVIITYSDVTTTSDEEYVYEYDYDESMTSAPLGELVPVTVVYVLTLVLGAIGNVLVVLAIVRLRRLQSITNIFLVSLASADLLLVCACVPIKVKFDCSSLL